MKISKALHIISHFRWLFLVWMIVLMVYIFFFKPDNTIPLVGTVILISGVMMGLTSLSDITKISDKQKKELLNLKIVKRQFILFFTGVVVLTLISVLFLFLKFIFLSADETFLQDFTKLGYDCLVMMLGFLILLKQFSDQVDYVKSHKNVL